MESIKKYYVFKNGEHMDSDGFYDFDDALVFAKECDTDEIELTIWNSEEDYENRKPADCFEIAWKK